MRSNELPDREAEPCRLMNLKQRTGRREVAVKPVSRRPDVSSTLRRDYPWQVASPQSLRPFHLARRTCHIQNESSSCRGEIDQIDRCHHVIRMRQLHNTQAVRGKSKQSAAMTGYSKVMLEFMPQNWE